MITQLGILFDIRRFAARAIGLADGHAFEAFAADTVRKDAACYALLCLGEAASRLETRFPGWLATHVADDISWRDLIGLRHVLAHNYDGLQLDRIWTIIREDVPTVFDAADRVVEAHLDEDGNYKDTP